MLGLKNGVELEDFYRNKHLCRSFEDISNLHKLSEEQRIKRSTEKLLAVNPTADVHMEPDNILDWLIQRGICPHALVSHNSRYHFENCVLLDGEMGLTLPDQKLSVGQTSGIFFQALNIVRQAKSKVREEDQKNGQNSSH